ncbi:sulfate adenylyltranferase, adenylylsulfate kinase [Thiobacillus denitrificans ATCC 25259]|uniref:Adenylyl-sulfate kinase n=2 Tax=Thiobacillus denitrificans TaxID=36861 RepID=Q3SM86_THIDA|nr:adenylyl-sulfate kinase [Thiobacillus denitrificans]AAZ96163.1 sulfate adenylyltranferase, adenylylsulfate kinase [Thiobacillus denitrificans ATCC 25259]
MVNQLIEPYGGTLVNLIDPEKREALKHEALSLPSLDLDWQQQCELEMLMTGAYSPLTGFMTRAQCARVESAQQLDDGSFWPSPITLTSRDRALADRRPGERLALRDGEGYMLAILTLSDVWKDGERWHLAGEVEGAALPPHPDFVSLRATPAELRALFVRRGWRRIIAWQARQPMHRAQYEFCLKSAIENEANLLLHPQVGGDITEAPAYFGLVRSFLAIRDRFPAATTQLSLLPAPPPEASGRALLLRAIVARNFGCSLLIAGGEHQPDGGDCRRGEDLTQNRVDPSVAERAEKIGVRLIAYPRMVYVEDRAEHLPEAEAPQGARLLTLSGEEFQRRMRAGLKIPEWYSFPEVLAELHRQTPPRERQGFTVFFTGLSGAGKSTLARALAARLMEMGGRCVTLLDGDIVRRHLSSELGFSKAHRDVNVRRIGFVASEITKNRGIAICAPIAPYRQTRRDVRAMIEAVGGFVEIHVATPIETCESRDRKGLYAKARAGLIPEFTGVSDPYEVPETPELAIDTTGLAIDEAVQQILLKLEHEGYLR